MLSQTDADYVNVAKQAFSYTGQARDYFLYRPTYPPSFFTKHVADIAAEARAREDERVRRGEARRQIVALDFGCGSGQATGSFLPHFDKVIGVDLNELQLEQALGRYADQIAAGRMEFWREDCSRIDEVIARRLRADQQQLALITVCQAFHWFDERDLLARCKRALAPHKGRMAVLGYKLYTMADGHKESKEAFEDFDKEVRGHYAFDPDQLDDLYRDKDFKEFFASVEFFREDTQYVGYPVQKFLGYLNTLSGYRTKLDRVDSSDADDSLRKAVDRLGLQGYRRGDPSEVFAPPGGVATVDFSVPFFMYVLHD